MAEVAEQMIAGVELMPTSAEQIGAMAVLCELLTALFVRVWGQVTRVPVWGQAACVPEWGQVA
jgi:hypothetical protein